MQAIYAWYSTGDAPGETFDVNLREFADQIRDHERRKGDKGDSRLLVNLFHDTIERRDEFDQLIQTKAENWELERIALVDRILMQMGICEMLNFEEIPIKVSINEYLEIAKKFSTPKSSKFINGILDSLYLQFKEEEKIQKRGRGLIEETLPKGRGANRGHSGHSGHSGGHSGHSGHSRNNPPPPSDGRKKRPRIRRDNDNPS